MDIVSDQNYLKNQQYRSGTNLDARIQLHQRFSTNPASFFEWMFDHLNLQAGAHVMEIGCGTGEIWRVNQQRLPADLQLTLLDLSTGMVSAAQSMFRDDVRLTFAAADAQNLPFLNSSFDTVLANYMLYHVPDISKAVRELRRVLKPGGWLCAATNGGQHMLDLYDLMNRFGSRASIMKSFTGRYGLENAPAILGACFEQVKIIPYNDSLFVTEPQALIEYIRSMVGIWNLTDSALAEIEHSVDMEIQAKGGFTIRKASGVVLAC